MPTEKNLTGYPSIDRPQEKFYRKEPIRKIKAEQTIYELVFNSNENNMLAPAIEYMGVTWTFKKLKNEVDKTADAFANLRLYAMKYLGRKITYLQMFERIESFSSVFDKEGIKEKDKVIVLALNTPDTICAIYALNKIGAVACVEYVTQKEISLGKITKQYDAKYAVVLDLFYEK